MAVVNYVGKQIARAWKKTLTVTTAVTTSAVTFTGGNGQVCAVTPTSTSTTTTAGEFAAALQAAGGVFKEFLFSAAGSVLTIVGPADGAPVTFSKSDGAGQSTTLATVDTPLSPHDVSDPLNWSTGALPVDATDSIDLGESDVPMLYNLDALAAIALVSPGFVRRRTFTSRIGLPTTNELGFPEYRTTELSVKSATYMLESASRDQADQLRILNTHSAGAVTVTIQGVGSNTALGSEAIVLRGLPGSSAIACVGGSLAIAPLQGQACTVATLNAIDSTIRVGPSATLSGTVRLHNCNARIQASWTTSLTQIGGSTEVEGSAAGTLVIEDGAVYWRSTGNPGASPVIGSGGTLDLSQSPATLTISGTIQMHAGSVLNDSAGRGGNWAAKTVHCRLDEVTILSPDDGTYSKS